MTQLRQTLWVINQSAISLDDFILKTQDYSTRFLSASNILCLVQSIGNGQEILTPIIVSNLFRIIQEAQNNIVKHAEASKVNIIINIKERVLNVQIIDNGVGMKSVKKKADHFGLKNIRDRVTELKGSLLIQSNSKGTKLLIKIPI